MPYFNREFLALEKLVMNFWTEPRYECNRRGNRWNDIRRWTTWSSCPAFGNGRDGPPLIAPRKRPTREDRASRIWSKVFVISSHRLQSAFLLVKLSLPPFVKLDNNQTVCRNDEDSGKRWMAEGSFPNRYFSFLFINIHFLWLPVRERRHSI